MKLALIAISVCVLCFAAKGQADPAGFSVKGTTDCRLWSDQSAGLIGGIAGSAVGLCGAIIGTLAGLGRAKRFVLGLTLALIVMGTASLLAGVLAASLGQPYGVYYPMLLVGGITAVVLGFNYRNIKRRYEQIELRKIQALDTQ